MPMLNLRRLRRHAMTNRLFCEPQAGFVAYTRSSRILLEDERMNNWVGFMTLDLWLPIARGSTWRNGHGIPWIDLIQLDEVFARRYNLSMQAHGGGEGYSVDDVVDGYPWGDLPGGATPWSM